MRPIKFRAWDIKYKRWLTPEAIATNIILNWNTEHADGIFWMDEFDGRIARNFGTDFEVMQFTGLLDKNGKEIYEGDVVKHRDGVFPVTWGDDIACFECNANNTSRTLYGYQREGIRVIGTIYENPELLETK